MKKWLKHYFIPDQDNDYTPRILQRIAMLMMLGLVLLSFAATNIQSILWFTSDWLVSTVLPGVIVDLTNQERAELSVLPLSRDPLLDEAARLKAEHMAKHQYFAHYSPDGVSPWHWFTEVSYPYVHAGENLAIHFSDSGEVVDAWMESPSHRANIANGDYQEIGVGTARGVYDGFDTVYVVQLFGTKKAIETVSQDTGTETVTIESQRVLAEETTVLASEVEVTPVVRELPVVEETLSLAEGVEEPEPQPFNNIVEVESTVEDTSLRATNTEIAGVEVNEELVSVYSGTIATTTKGVPASIEEIGGEHVRQSSLLGGLATQPSALLQALYILIGLFVATVLLISILIEVKHQRPLQIAYSLGLLLVMSGLFYLHTLVSGGAVIV